MPDGDVAGIGALGCHLLASPLPRPERTARHLGADDGVDLAPLVEDPANSRAA